MLRTITLYGSLKDLAQTDTFELDVDTPVALLTGMRSLFNGFRQWCDDHRLAVVLTDDTTTPVPLDVSELTMQLGQATNIHLVPETEGAGFEIATIMAAIAAGSYATALYYIAVNIAIAVVVGVIISALSPTPDMSGGSARSDERPSFLFNGPVNVVEQGYPVPLVYGTHMTGSIIISAGVEVEDIPYEAEQEDPPANGGGDPQPAPPPSEEYQSTGGM